MCGFIVFIFCQVEGWCQEHWIMQYVWVEGFMLPGVNMTQVLVEVQCGFGFVWSKEFEKKK